MSTARRVTFNQSVDVHEIMSIYDFTASEISAAWYDEDEMNKITQRCFKIIGKYESGKSKNGRKYCIRGLEGHTTLGSITKRSNRSEAYTATLDEQERHWNDSEDILVRAMSHAYRQISSSCQMWAQVVGHRDQQAVEEYLFADEDQDVAFVAERVVPAAEHLQPPVIFSSPHSRIRKMANASAQFSPRSVTVF